MEQLTPYKYKAQNAGSYRELATFAITTSANVALYPELATIVIVPTETTPNIIKDFGSYIDREGLDFLITPIEIDGNNYVELLNDETTDAGTLRTIVRQLLDKGASMAESNRNSLSEISAKYEYEVQRGNDYKRWWQQTNQQLDRVKGQVKSIGILINSIFPEDVNCSSGSNS